MSKRMPPALVWRVAHDSRASSLGRALSAELQRGQTVELHAIGEKATYVLVKGLCIAQQLLEQARLGLVCKPVFAAASGAGRRTEVHVAVMGEYRGSGYG